MSNPSGWECVEFNCLVKVEEVATKTPGGIIMPDKLIDEKMLASTEATLVAVSPLAFTYETWPEGSAKPQPGERILMAKYAGSPVKGVDGIEYRVIKDKDILAVRNAA